MILVSVSGGKDSTASLLLALEQSESPVEAMFCDTGNEHELTYEYVDYLEQKTGVKIARLKADLSAKWWKRRDYVRDKWADKGVPDADIRRVLAVLEKGPTGNPFVDICIIKGMFPSRKKQFCTQYLKKEVAEQHTLMLLKGRKFLESWQGVRAEESANRAKLPQRDVEFGQWEPEKEGFLIFRPILHWNVEQVFAQHRKHGVEPNPLYKQGMNRVGCMPCINACKPEIFQIASRFPEHIDRIAEWENVIRTASKKGQANFFPYPTQDPNLDVNAVGNIRERVKWSMTKHGGKELDIKKIEAQDNAVCSSAYGLCE